MSLTKHINPLTSQFVNDPVSDNMHYMPQSSYVLKNHNIVTKFELYNLGT